MKTFWAIYSAVLLSFIFSVPISLADYWTPEPAIKVGDLEISPGLIVCVGSEVTLALTNAIDFDTYHYCIEDNKEKTRLEADTALINHWLVKKKGKDIIEQDLPSQELLKFTPQEPGKYKVKVYADDKWPPPENENQNDEKSAKKTATITVLKVEMAFQTSGMTSTKVIPNPEYQRIGVLKGDSITFSAVLTPSVALPNSDYSWSGEKTGNGPSISVTFNNLGNSRTENLQVLGCNKTATITVIEVPPPDQTTWAFLMTTLYGPAWVLKINDLADEALAWAQANQTTLGGGLHNGKADAARHTYWNVLMIMEGYSPADAWGAGQSHERSNIAAGGPHNESVMDLENNQKGINMGAGLTTRAAGQAAVISGLTAGNLTYLDDLTNSGERGLLQPTNK